VAQVIMARPRRPAVKAAHDLAAWAEDPPRPVKDVVATYRRWLDNERDLACVEPMPGEGPPATVTRLRPASAEEQRLERQRRRLAIAAGEGEA
jgi:hypothetical protein